MRTARIRGGGRAVYHCMSRVIDRRMILGEVEKERFRGLLRQVEGFCGVRVLTYVVMTNHFHVLVQVPRREEVSDGELVRRVGLLYSRAAARELKRELSGLREAGENEQAEALKARYTYRMYNLSEFMKTLKQRFTQWYNRRNGRRGTLWEERFKSVLLEHRVNALQTMAMYIDLNPVRAGLVEDPKDYRYSGYGEAVAGGKDAREGIGVVLEEVVAEGDWRRVSRVYRQGLFDRGRGSDQRPGLSPVRVRQVLAEGGELSKGELLHCRVRYFSDGVVLGSREFVESVFSRHREEFGLKRKTGARRMRHGDWGGLCTMRDLRLDVVIPAQPG